MIALVLALAVLQLQRPTVPYLQSRPSPAACPTCSRASHLQRRVPCEPYAETCRGSVIYTCVAGRWRRGIDCARAGRRDRVTVCSQEIDGSAICVENGGATP